MRKKVETEKRALQVKRETVKLLTVKATDVQKVAGGIPTTAEPGCRTNLQGGKP